MEEEIAVKIESHRDLIVWQKAMELAVLIYPLTKDFPKTGNYRLTSQLTRAATSVPANIAEGHARGTRKDYANFLSIAKGSLAQTETFLLIARELNFTTLENTNSALSLIVKIGKMLTSLRSKFLSSSATCNL